MVSLHALLCVCWELNLGPASHTLGLPLDYIPGQRQILIHYEGWNLLCGLGSPPIWHPPASAFEVDEFIVPPGLPKINFDLNACQMKYHYTTPC